MITKTIQVSILVKDIEASKEFYVNKLGFKICTDQFFSSNSSFLTVAPQKDNSMVLELVKTETEEQEKLVGNQCGNQILIMFETNNIEKDYQRMKQKRVTFHGEPKNIPGGKGLGFKDLYGNEFYLYQPIE